MASVDPIFAQWLQDEGLWSVGEDVEVAELWGDSAITAERMTAIAGRGYALDEAERQLAFLKGPLAIDDHLLIGEWRHRRGQVVTLTINQLGYEQGADVFVIAAEDNKATGLSKVTVIKRL